MPLQATSGAASYDAFGGGVPVEPNYIESCFSTYLYTGTGVAQTITNGIDVSTKGGLVWIKCRNVSGESHVLVDSARGATRALRSNGTDAEVNDAGRVSAFTTSGFTIGTDGELNGTGNTHASWTFRKQPKFFDVVTFTSTDTNVTVSHNLGSVPGCIIIKRTDDVDGWFVYHRSTPNNYLYLNSTAAAATPAVVGTVNSTTFQFKGSDWGPPSTATYVAYIFAHDAGGFGLTGTDNVISCGSFTTGTGFGAFNVNLGWEPQWVLIKRTDGFRDWVIYDTMRGFNTRNLTGDADALALYPNLSSAEDLNGYVGPYATGFSSVYTGTASANYIYIAIRRGPMKVPTSGTSVFSPITYTGNSTTNTTVQNLTTSFAGDATIIQQRDGGNNPLVFDKLRGSTQGLYTSLTLAEENIAATRAGQSVGFNNTQTVLTGQFTNQGNYNYLATPFVGWNFKRAPSFFDEVCYKGNGSTQTITHNLGVVPELIIGKNRTTTGNNWPVLFNFASTTMNYGFLNLTNSCPNDTYANVGVFSAAPTSTSMFLVNSGSMNTNTDNHVAYLFATCAGVSKVFSYTGNGSSQTINCGFTGGARFVLIKRTDSTGDWYVWDSARGIVSGNDPHLSLNTTAAEVTSDDTIDTDSTGFVVNQVSATNVNVSSATYIGLAIA